MNAKQPVPELGFVSDSRASVRLAIDATLKRARLLHERGLHSEAQRGYRAVLSLDPLHLEATHLLGIVHFQLGEPEVAEPLIARSLQMEPSNASMFANHGAVLVNLGRHESALVSLGEALRLDPQCAAAWISRGNAFFALRKFNDAHEAYDRALAVAPKAVEAWRNRGRALSALGRPADALISFGRALHLGAHDEITHVSRGDALRELGQHEEALTSYKRALALKPRSPELLGLCGRQQQALGRYLDALASLDASLAVRPDDIDTLYLSCVVLNALRRHETLLERCDRILTLNPNHVLAWIGRGNALQGLQRQIDESDALKNARSPTVRHELSVAVPVAIGTVHAHGAEKYAEALQAYDRALALVGPTVEIMACRGNILLRLGRHDEARAAYDASLTLPTQGAMSWFMRAVALEQARRYEEAIACYQRVQELDSGHVVAQSSEAYCRLLVGDFVEGWKKHESRWLEPQAASSRRHVGSPLWLGQDEIEGKTILLHAEQGYGDTLQFCRYAGLLKSRGAVVVLEVPPSLKVLAQTIRDVEQVIAIGEPVPSFDFQCPLMSLPLACGTTLSTIPADIPYLSADTQRVEKWSARLSEIDGSSRLKIGIAWSGNPTHDNDHSRSAPLSELADIFTFDAMFVSLQPQVRERDAVALRQTNIVDFGAELRDFADTAALIQCLDLIVAVDTAVVHLAGALGKSVWVLVSSTPDWRWLLERDDSPWYPGARLFRQTSAGDWTGLARDVADALSESRKSS